MSADQIALGGELDPGLIRPLTGDDHLGVVMPMRISSGSRRLKIQALVASGCATCNRLRSSRASASLPNCDVPNPPVGMTARYPSAMYRPMTARYRTAVCQARSVSVCDASYRR